MSNLLSNYIRKVNLGFCFQNWFTVGDPFSCFGYQPVRWRKPRWLPKAPSKLYKVTQRKRLPPDESSELLRLYQNFKCFMRLTIEHCSRENAKEAEFGLLSAQHLEEEKEHRRLMDLLRLENERMAQLRSQRLEKEKEELLERIIEFKTEKEERAKQDKESALQKLQQTKELAASFIEPEGFEKAIEDAINNPTDYNYAVDLDGRKYSGRMTQAHLVDLENLERLEQKDDGLTNQF